MLPELQHELRILLATARANLAQLPEQSRNHVAKASKIIGDFLGAAGKHLEGAPGRDGLHQSIRGPLSVFTAAIRTSAPDFRPYPPPRQIPPRCPFRRSLPHSVLATRVAFHKCSSSGTVLPYLNVAVKTDRAIYLDEVKELANM